MDNITHAIAGMLLAEAAVQISARRTGSEPTWRAAAYFASISAHSIPDFDFVLSPLTAGRLGYLLHHRGHTHTLALAVPLAILCLLPVLGWWRLRKRSHGIEGWAALAILAGIGPVIHVLLDFTNNYGVHPFWPFDNRWFYGDSVFIIEPLLLASSIGPLFFLVRSRSAKTFLVLVLVATIAAAWFSGIARWPAALFVTLASLGMFALVAKRDDATRVGLAIGFWIAVTLAFSVAAHYVRSTAIAEHRGAAEIRDLIVTPLPGDLFCWHLISVETNETKYAIRLGTLSALPSLVSPESCPETAREHTAILSKSNDLASEHVVWRSEIVLELSELAELSRDCRAGAFLRFARAPYWQRSASGSLVVGDLRYDREVGLGFAELEIDPTAPCPKRVPPWVPPRAEIVAEAEELAGFGFRPPPAYVTSCD
jgi:inner membrane protein